MSRELTDELLDRLSREKKHTNSLRCDFCDILIFPKERAIKISGTRVPIGSSVHSSSRRLFICPQCSDIFGIPSCGVLQVNTEDESRGFLDEQADGFETIEDLIQDLHSQGELT